MNNQFLEALQSYDSYTANGAISHSTTGSSLLDYFSKAATYADRSEKEVAQDLVAMWSESPLATLQMIFYMRLVTRNVKDLTNIKQGITTGQGRRNEFRKAILFLIDRYPQHLYANMWLIPLVGCWKDLWHEDIVSKIDHDEVIKLVKMGLQDPYNAELIKKYMPKIRSKSNTTTDRHRALNNFARKLSNALGFTSTRQYRKFKSSGSSHKFQTLMCQNLWTNLDFNKIPGKALFNITTRKGKDQKTVIERHNLDSKYLAWIDSKPVAPFTGYPFELAKAYQEDSTSKVVKNTVDKQFQGLIELAKKNTQQGKGLTGNVFVAVDTSGSMTINVDKKGTTALHVSTSLGVYFSTLNTGHFKDHVIGFDSKSTIIKLTGTFSDKLDKLRRNSFMGSTNFKSVIEEIVRVRKENPNIPLSDYPKTVIVVSDMQFDPIYQTYDYMNNRYIKSNSEAAKKKLKDVGLEDIQFVWWQVNANYGTDSTVKAKDDNNVYISGFDGAAITTILGGQQEVVDQTTGQVRKMNPYEQMIKVLNQSLLTQVKLP